jgi:hypothetical protein
VFLMQMRYDEALDSIIEHTEIGYTIASQDRLWIVFIFDLWSEDEFRYNRLYSTGIGEPWTYELLVGETSPPVWTSRREAEVFAEQLRQRLIANSSTDSIPEVYVMNLGDDARYENLVIGGHKQARTTPKFKGSKRAWGAQIEMRGRWIDRVSRNKTEGDD